MQLGIGYTEKSEISKANFYHNAGIAIAISLFPYFGLAKITSVKVLMPEFLSAFLIYLTRDYYDRYKVAGFRQFRHIFPEPHFPRSLIYPPIIIPS